MYFQENPTSIQKLRGTPHCQCRISMYELDNQADKNLLQKSVLSSFS